MVGINAQVTGFEGVHVKRTRKKCVRVKLVNSAQNMLNYNKAIRKSKNKFKNYNKYAG